MLAAVMEPQAKVWESNGLNHFKFSLSPTRVAGRRPLIQKRAIGNLNTVGTHFVIASAEYARMYVVV